MCLKCFFCAKVGFELGFFVQTGGFQSGFGESKKAFKNLLLMFSKTD